MVILFLVRRRKAVARLGVQWDLAIRSRMVRSPDQRDVPSATAILCRVHRKAA
jgi:hypothetical protein